MPSMHSTRYKDRQSNHRDQRCTVPYPREENIHSHSKPRLRKVYDRMDHDYIFEVLGKMGFPGK